MATEQKTIRKKLTNIQTALKVAKAESGRFGSYRSAEGILTAVKPLLEKEDVSLVLSSEIVEVNGKNYVKTSAILEDDGDQKCTVSAMAWEGEISRGLDAPQVTGSATSYSRKYALSGLFAIDDGKDDPDSHKTPPKTKDEEKQEAEDANASKPATAPEKVKLRNMMIECHIAQGEMSDFINMTIGKDRVETHGDFVEVYHALEEMKKAETSDDDEEAKK